VAGDKWKVTGDKWQVISKKRWSIQKRNESSVYDSNEKLAVRSFKDLVVWQKSMVLAKEVYEMTRSFPDEERFGLAAQLRRCAVSIPSNIAEGQGRSQGKEFLRYLQIAKGSQQELETQILLCDSLGYLNKEQSAHMINLTHEVGRMLAGLGRSVRAGMKSRSKTGQT